jgi:hypothetical protein
VQPLPFVSLRSALVAATPLVTVQAAVAVVWGAVAARAPVAVPGLFAAGFLALAYAAWRLGRSPSVSAAGILLVALGLRLLALPLAPSLSHDVDRYVWDGRVALAGENPYLRAPADPALAPLAEGGSAPEWRRLEHREVPTVYPPLALALFAFAAATPAPVLVLKLLLALADLAGCAALLALARHLGLPPARAVWYAWNPLVVIETAGMGHVDALGVALAVAAVLLVVRRRPAWAGAAAAAGVLAKLGPLLALPLWARRSGRPLVLLAVAGAVLLAALAPVVVAVGGVPPGLSTYAVSWEFDGPLYEPAWRLLDAAGAGDAVKGILDRLKDRTGEHELWNRFYPYAYPRFLAKLGLALLLAVALVRSLSDRRPVAGTGALFGAALLASATVYPWYLLWVLPWAALARQPAWLLACALAPLAYLVALPGGAGFGSDPFPWVWLAVWGPPAVGCLVFPRFRRWSTD